MNCTTFASLYGATAQSGTGCSAVGSAPGLGPGGRPFESGHPDNKAKGRSKRNLQKGLAKRNKRCTFAAQLRNGALDEWLSQRSAKPSTAVRIRQAPPLKGKAIEKTSSQGVSFCYVQGRDDGMFGGMGAHSTNLGSPDKCVIFRVQETQLKSCAKRVRKRSSTAWAIGVVLHWR